MHRTVTRPCSHCGLPVRVPLDGTAVCLGCGESCHAENPLGRRPVAAALADAMASGRPVADVTPPADVLDADIETEALRELSRRVDRTRTWALLVPLIAGVLVGVPGYFFVSELQFQYLGGAWAYFSAAGFFAPLLLGAVLGKLAGRLLVRQRRGAWLAEIAARHRVSAEALDRLFVLL